jgi:hypothetical protein
MFPDSGLIRYYVSLNQERLLVTSSEGLSEILVRRIDDYDHPAVTKFATMRVTGNGLQFAVGDEHKVRGLGPFRACLFRTDCTVDTTEASDAGFQSGPRQNANTHFLGAGC